MSLYSRDPYGNLPRARAINLRYGSKLRYIKCLRANANSAVVEGTFTEEDLNTIDKICTNALVRAEKVYNEEKQREAEASGRTSEEYRQYTGK